MEGTSSEPFNLTSNGSMTDVIPSTAFDPPAPDWILQWTNYGRKYWFVTTAVFGLPGNLMSLLVTLRKDNRRISTCVYMAALAIVDSGVLINTTLHKILVIQGWTDEATRSSKPLLR